MALANVAFLAAMNGLNVLVMDWDLEAPGLHHYFRGIVESEDMASLKKAEGVLDIVWEWRNRIQEAKDRTDVERIFADFRSGDPFSRRLRPIWPDNEFNDDGRIDIITAGAAEVRTPNPIEYERALASFSWSDFLDQYAGGGLIDALRNWSSKNYDLILIDSRTGLADVAGICTMQLPDAVVLAFVLNRQNIEGAARVAWAIRQARKDDVRIWPVPMRVSREGTAEEADASARALREFVRIGGLDIEQTERDMRGLLIKAEPNIPFMESLAPFNDTDAALDPLTANMARLTKEITGIEIAIPDIPSAWRDQVHSRLAPAMSTEGYLRQLMSAEPLRASRELHRFVESAIATISDNEPLADDYVVALVETSFALQQRGDGIGEAGYDTPSRVIMLLRRLYEKDHDRWRIHLIDSLQSSLDIRFDFLAPEDELITLEEIDDLLSAENQSVDILLRRAETRLRVARLLSDPDEAAQRLSAAEEALSHVRRARKDSNENNEDLEIIRLDATYQRADALISLGQSELAEQALKKIVQGLDTLFDKSNRGELARLSFDANYKLMVLATDTDAVTAASYAQAAIRRGNPMSAQFLARVSEISEVMLKGPDPHESADLLLRRLVAPPATPRTVANFFARGPRMALRFIEALAPLVLSASKKRSDDLPVLIELSCEVVSQVLKDSERRIAPSFRTNSIRFNNATQSTKLLVDSAKNFVDLLISMNDPDIEDVVSDLTDRVQSLELHWQRAMNPAKSKRDQI